uniref:Protein LLP homolog n=1 Tax=Catagonus wagneri TaxID=51154 RepID=A0A8C3VPA5_9CETA
MAESLQSKWERKMRTEKKKKKPKKNGPKELSKLKCILKVDGDVLMKDIQEIATVMEPKSGFPQSKRVSEGAQDGNHSPFVI